MVNRIKERREGLQLTRQACADQLSVDYTTFWRWENGEMTPKSTTMLRLAALLQTTAADLFPSFFQPLTTEEAATYAN